MRYVLHGCYYLLALHSTLKQNEPLLSGAFITILNNAHVFLLI